MATPLLKTKLYIPPVRPDPSTALRTGLVSRPRLIERLNEGLLRKRKLALISAPAGFDKTALLSEWVHHLETGFFPKNLVSGLRPPVAWLSLDEGDNDPAHFLAYFIAAIQTIRQDIGQSVVAASQSSQPLAIQALLTALVNEIAAAPQGDHKGRPYVLVLDDYHLITAQPIHDGLTFLLDHLPSQLHLVIATSAACQSPLTVAS